MTALSTQERRYACDVHTHTVYSRHAYSTVEENVRAAADCGLELLGISEHFSDMLFENRNMRNFQYFANFHCWPRDWHGVRLLHGCEADIVDLEGHLFGWDTTYDKNIVDAPIEPLTLKDYVFEECDYVVASVHNKVFTENASIAQTTEMYVHALEDPKVFILGHTGRSGVPFDVDELLTVAHDLHKLIEINEHSFAAYYDPYVRDNCRRIAERCAEMGVQIAVNSDAHISYNVGRLQQAPLLLDEIDFPADLIATRSAKAFEQALSDAGLALAGTIIPPA
ncbi:phosphatase [uncultured Olegusella sp.]|uniref:phosphatase n=1 Tax=uncultured Olegusella sp. TaxID=1979846 RepID=UPI00263888C9|nr:phosphatase [uncultured Olegusella sp.]